MSSSYLEADFSVLTSTIRARLQKHRSHRLKVCAYKWLDMTLVELHAFARTQLSLGHKLLSIAYRNCYGLSEIVSELGREPPMKAKVPVEEGVNDVIARVVR